MCKVGGGGDTKRMLFRAVVNALPLGPPALALTVITVGGGSDAVIINTIVMGSIYS